MSSVPYVKLKELCDVNQGLQIPISKRFREDGENRYFYITVQFLKDSHLEKFYIENPSKSSICHEDDIIVVRTGSTGQIITGVKGCFHNNFFKINYDKTKVHGRFLYYCLLTKEKQLEMKRRAGITTIPDLNHFMFLDMAIPYPDYSYQLEASNILDLINQKIEINNKINAQLEAMAKLIYDYWFVQFDFPDANGKPYKSSGGKMVYNEELKREIPEGWDVESLDYFVELIANTVSPTQMCSKTLYIGLEHIPRKTIIMANWVSADKVNSNKIAFKKMDILFGKIRPYFHKVGVSFIDGVTSTDTIVLRAKQPEYHGLALQTVFTERFVATASNSSTGSKMPRADWEVLKSYKVPAPSVKVLCSYQSMFDNFLDEMENNITQNRELIELRDWVLPMLMNGQVTIKEP